MNHLSLRRATEADIPQVRQLASKIWWEHYPSIIGGAQIEYMLDLMYSESALQRQMTVDAQEFWLPEKNAQVLGFLALSRKGAGEYFLHKFYLDNRGQGLGTIVFDLLLEQYPDLHTLRLQVNRGNFKSINFYFKLGFRIEFCTETLIGQGYVMDDFQMIYTHALRTL